MSGLRSRQERKADVLTALAQNRDLWLPSHQQETGMHGPDAGAGLITGFSEAAGWNPAEQSGSWTSIDSSPSVSKLPGLWGPRRPRRHAPLELVWPDS
jgi:hypothetical protein